MGYPEWWDDLKKRKVATKAPTNGTGSKVHLTTVDQPSSCDMSGSVKGYKGEEDIVAGTKTERRKE